MTTSTPAGPPRTFKGMIDRTPIVAELMSMVKEGRVPPLVLFTGLPSEDKAHAARVLTAALNCYTPEGGDACGTCSGCVGALENPINAFIHVDRDRVGAQDVTALRQIARTAPYEGPWLVFAFGPARWTQAAVRELLVSVAKGAPNVCHILFTEALEGWPPSLQSAARTLRFESPSPAVEETPLKV